MNVSVRDYFEYYTESAAIDNANYSRSYLNSSSETCIPSDKDQVITLYLRNPQNYRLNYSYSYLDSNIGEIAGTKKQTTEDELYVKFDNDRNMVQLRFTSDFLQEIERQKTFTKVEDGRTVKYHTNLASGKIGITEPDSGRSFENFALNFHVNSYPPKVQGAALQRSGAGNDAVYILCFFMPELGEDKGNFNGIHDRDTRKLSINNNIYYINGSNVYSSASYDSSSDRWNFADENKASGFTTVQPSTLKALDGIGYSFDGSVVPTGYVVQYFTTGEKPSTEETRFTVSLIDDEGLNSAVTVSNRAKQLEKPEVIFEDSSMTVGEDDGLYEVTFTHGNRTREINTVDENGNAISYPSESVDGEISIGYTIKETRSGKVYSGNGTAPLKVKIPKGFYDFEVYAFKDYYITSLMNTDNTNVHIKESGIYYISSSGSEDGTGKKASPLRRIQQAVDRFEEGLANNDFDSASVCSIRILSDISPTANDAFVNSSFIDLKSGRTYVLMGYDGTYTIDAAGKSRVIHAGAGSEYTFKNLVVRGGSSSTYGAGVYLESTSGNKIKAEFENVTVENNSGANAGGGIFFSGVNADDYLFLNNCKVRNNSTTGGYGGGLISNGSNGTIRLSNTVISENSCSDQGAGVYAECTLILEDGTEITGNTSGTSAAGVYTASTTTIKLSGKITINGNKAGGINSNVYLPDGVLFNIQGSIAGSVIGFTTEKVPASLTEKIAFTTGYGYGSQNTSMPGACFKNDANVGVTYDDVTKEAVLALSGGGLNIETGDNLVISNNSSSELGNYCTYLFTVKKNSVDVTDKCTFSYTLRTHGDVVENTNSVTYYSFANNTFTFHKDTLPTDSYTIMVTAKYPNGDGTYTTGTAEFGNIQITHVSN